VGSKYGNEEVRKAITKNLINAHVRVERRKSTATSVDSGKKKKRTAGKKAQHGDTPTAEVSTDDAGATPPRPAARHSQSEEIDDDSEKD